MHRKYTPEIIEFIRNNIKGVKYKDMAAMIYEKFNLKVNPDALGQWCTKNHLQNGLTGCFEKGHIPANKGKKWDDYLTPEQQAKARQTCFSSERIVNNQNHTWYHKIGDEMEDKDGYIKVKCFNHAKENGGDARHSTRCWKLKNRLLWEQNYGPIPDDSIIIFLDGNTRNFDLSNLAMITKKENAIINKYGLRYDDPECTKLGIKIAKLKVLMREKEKGKHNEQDTK